MLARFGQVLGRDEARLSADVWYSGNMPWRPRISEPTGRRNPGCRIAARRSRRGRSRSADGRRRACASTCAAARSMVARPPTDALVGERLLVAQAGQRQAVLDARGAIAVAGQPGDGADRAGRVNEAEGVPPPRAGRQRLRQQRRDRRSPRGCRRPATGGRRGSRSGSRPRSRRAARTRRRSGGRARASSR